MNFYWEELLFWHGKAVSIAKRLRGGGDCLIGNFDGLGILPVMKAEDVPPSELEEGDTALYTGGGGRVIAREAGDVEVFAKGPAW